MTAPVPDDKLRLGGMALRNGLLVHGPTHWAAAVRTDDGELRVASGRKPDLGGKASARVPGLRGIAKLAEALAVVPLAKRALPEARLPMQDLKTVGAMGAAALGGQAIRARTRGVLPAAGPGALAGEAAVALLSLAPALLALRSGDLAAYHGVEHKAIAGYEADADAADADKEHDRCGSHLVAPMLTAAALGQRRRPPGRAARARRRRGGRPRQRGGGRGGVRLGGAQPRLPPHTPAAQARPRDPARSGHPRADRGAARGRPGGARGDPQGRAPGRLGRAGVVGVIPFSNGHRGQPSRSARSRGLPPPGRQDPGGLLHATRTSTSRSGCWRRGAASAGDDAGLPAPPVGSRRDR